MRIVAGEYRGRQLVAPAGASVRPTSDRVREAIGNALTSLEALEGAAVIDCFAGSGALGLEALSRGAAHVTFVEQDRVALGALRANVAAIGVEDRSTIVSSAVERFLDRRRSRRVEDGRGGGRRGLEDWFDVAFLDPPYAFDEWSTLLVDLPATLAVIESDRSVSLDPAWEAVREKRYGGTVVTIARRVS